MRMSVWLDWGSDSDVILPVVVAGMVVGSEKMQIVVVIWGWNIAPLWLVTLWVLASSCVNNLCDIQHCIGERLQSRTIRLSLLETLFLEHCQFQFKEKVINSYHLILNRKYPNYYKKEAQLSQIMIIRLWTGLYRSKSNLNFDHSGFTWASTRTIFMESFESLSQLDPSYP